MAIGYDRIWQVPVYLPYLQPDLSDEAIEAAESKLGVSLPSAYIDLLRVQNGGYIRLSLPETCNEVIAGIGPHFPSLKEVDWSEVSDWVSFDPEGLIPFDSDGHWHLCFDYRRSTGAPRISYIDIECDSEEVVAKSFEEYLDLLCFDDKREYVVTGGNDIEEIVTTLSNALKKRFELTGEDDNGYAQYRVRLGGSKFDPEWLWIAPNRVPRGFVRRDDPRYNQLKAKADGWGLRFPECPEASCTLTATEGVAEQVKLACSDAALNLIPVNDLLDS